MNQCSSSPATFQLLKLGCIVLICLNFLLACESPNDKNLACRGSNTVKLAKEAVDFFYFRPGSWWVYKNLRTGVTDSHWVSESYLTNETYYRAKREHDEDDDHCYEHGSVRILNKEHEDQYLFNREFWIQLDHTKDFTALTSYILELVNVTPANVPRHYRAAFEGQQFIESNTEYGRIRKLPSITAAGKRFENVLNFRHSEKAQNQKSFGQYDFYRESWMAHKIGLVQYIDTVGDTCALIRFQVR